MKICVPTENDAGLDAPVCSHFGRAPFFTVVDMETDAVTSFPNQGHHHGGTKTPAEVVSDHAVDVILTSNLGPRAVSLFKDKGIRVHTGATGTVAQAIDQFKRDTLKPASLDNACKDHEHG